MTLCTKCNKDFKNIGVHQRFCNIPKPIKKEIQKEDKEEDVSLEDKIDKLTRKIESMESDKDLESSFNMDNSEQKSQMFSIDKKPKEITGDATEAILKSRFENYEDAKKSIRPYAQRYYSTLDNTRYGGDSLLIPIEEIEMGLWNMDEIKKFDSWDEIEEIQGREYIRIFIEMASIVQQLEQVARIASKDGYARQEDIHKSGAKAEGQQYIEAHIPPPNMYPKKYGESQQKVEQASKAILEPEE